ncbi:hypothetical protein [Marinobacter sp. SS5-14b]|uniref:hypothetical protein n=1 Tax=Marinobacter sp. SS5-14b TaxID=3050456 RepID=UPI0026DF1699|nr:hypothetical protein [Marinobacter sp. SS5-14b]
MSTVLKAASISRALFEFDPMRTCCKENDCFDEYDRAAESVEERLGACKPNCVTAHD